MKHNELGRTSVMICDWHGRVVWTSRIDLPLQSGEYAWQHLADEVQEEAKNLFARTVSLEETTTMEGHNNKGLYFRSWLWPLFSPEAAVCVLSIEIPKELSSLTNREREIMGLLALGYTTRDMAKQLDVSTSTIHTHLRRAREKLSLPSIESLTGFAARYCHPNATPPNQ